MAKLTSLSLEELYAKPKFTRAVELAIIDKSDFKEINGDYCAKVCKLKCKATDKVNLLTREVDILIIQDHQAPAGKFDRAEGQQERIQQGVIQFLVKRAGFDNLRVKVTSLLKCEASAQDFPSGKPPTETVLKKCAPYLYEEIRQTKPRVIISLATPVTKALGLMKHSNTGNRGEIAISPMFDIPVVITLHPRIMTFIRQNARGAGGMWGPDYLGVIQNDFEKAAKIVHGKLKYDNETLKKSVKALQEAGVIRIAKSMEDVGEYMAILQGLPKDRIVSFDTETTSLDPLDPKLKLLSIQFGYRENGTGRLKALVIPLNHRRNTFYDPDKAWELVEPFLLSDQPKVGHNSKYDILVIYWAKGVRVKNVKFDTLLLLHSICSGAQGTYGLKAAVWDRIIETGLGGYEDLLGDLKALKKQLEKAQGQVDPDEVQQEQERTIDVDFG